MEVEQHPPWLHGYYDGKPDNIYVPNVGSDLVMHAGDFQRGGGFKPRQHCG